MISKRHVFFLASAAVLAASLPASAQDTIKIGELNSYKSQPAFLEPYKKGIDLAVDEINAKGGVLGKKIEIVQRDDGANPGEAVRVAEELVTREGVPIIAGTFLSHIGLAVTNFAGQKKVFFLAAEPLTDKITWQNGNRYTYRLRSTTYMQTAMLMPAATAAKKKRWALVYPNFEYGQSAAENFKALMKKAQPDVEFVTEQAPPLGKIDAGAVAQAIDDAKPDAIFNVLFGGDLAKFVREGNTRGVFKDRFVVSLLSGEPEYLDPLKDEAPVGWVVTGYPWDKIKTPEHLAFVTAYQQKFNDYPRLGSVVGYVTIKSIAAGIAKAKSTDTEKLVEAFKDLKVDSPFGPFEYRASDHQATMGAYVGKIALENGKGTMTDFKYVDGKDVLPSAEEVKKLRPAESN
jgi:branched-chain amino acid transport system substrate-binding protein